MMRGQRGATYIEVLVAGVILALGLLGLCNMLVLGFADVTSSGKTTAGVGAARQVLEDVKLLPFDNITNLQGFSTDTSSSQPASDPEREVARKWRYALAGEGAGWSFSTAEKTRWTDLSVQGGNLAGVGSITVTSPSTNVREVTISVRVPGRFSNIRIATRIVRL